MYKLITHKQPDGATSVIGDDANGLRLGQCWAMQGSSGFVEVMCRRPAGGALRCMTLSVEKETFAAKKSCGTSV